MLAFFIFKFARMYLPGYAILYAPVRKILTYFGIITIFLACATIGAAIKCMTNFRKGLKPHIIGYELSRNLLEDGEMEMSISHHRNK